MKSNNDASILRVLKSLELLGPNGETTQTYADFMRKDSGPAALGRKIKTVYSKLFENVTSPESASNSELTNFFNIHSGGSAQTIKYQIDTFKALAAYATFGHSDPLEQPESDNVENGTTNRTRNSSSPAIRIDLHIHLPENKSKSDYDAILESIANHIYGRGQ